MDVAVFGGRHGVLLDPLVVLGNFQANEPFTHKVKACLFESWSLFSLIQVGLIKDATPAKGLKCPYLT